MQQVSACVGDGYKAAVVLGVRVHVRGVRQQTRSHAVRCITLAEPKMIMSKAKRSRLLLWRHLSLQLANMPASAQS